MSYMYILGNHATARRKDGEVLAVLVAAHVYKQKHKPIDYAIQCRMLVGERLIEVLLPEIT